MSRKKNIESMGLELGETYFEIWQETARLHSKWQEYKDLYGVSKEQIELLNFTAPSFFKIVQDMFWESVMLQLCRLTDPINSAGRSNLTIRRFSQLVDCSIKTEIDSLVEIAIDSTSFCRDWRNRRIAHRDLDMSTGKNCIPLEKASILKVDDSIRKIESSINYVQRYYENTTTLFDGGSLLWGAKSLIHRLEILRTDYEKNEPH